MEKYELLDTFRYFNYKNTFILHKQNKIKTFGLQLLTKRAVSYI